MSILIKMEMPKNCKGCRFKGLKPYWDDDGDRHIGDACMLCGELVDAKIRSSVCQLVEVPKHGDLIDREALMEKAFRYQVHGKPKLKVVLASALRDAPTIIESED